jgi:signal recognition particle receptor subunit beta
MTAVPTQLPERSVTLKTVVVGGPGAGKTTFVNSASDIRTLSTDEPQTGAAPATTTVALDFGRATVAHGDLRLELALFGFPGQERFSFLWSRSSPEHGRDWSCSRSAVLSMPCPR